MRTSIQCIVHPTEPTKAYIQSISGDVLQITYGGTNYTVGSVHLISQLQQLSGAYAITLTNNSNYTPPA